MNVLVTGANGLLGQHIVRLLREDPQFDVMATARGKNRLKDAGGYRYATLDICDEGQVKTVVEQFHPEVIIHTAAMTQVDDCETKKEQCWQVNVQATGYLVRAARTAGSFLLLLSTDFIFDGEAGPYTEEALPNPLSYYGISKLAAEMMLLESGIRWAIARTVLVYGIAEDISRSNIILWVKSSLEQGKKIKVVDDQWRTPTLVQDLAMGCKLIAGKKAEGIFNISGRDLLTPYEMAVKTAGYFNLDQSLMEKADSATFTQPAKRPARTGFIIDKARKELGYAPHSLEEGIRIVAGELNLLGG